MVLSERNWETVGTQNLGSFGSPQGGDPNNMLETRMGPRDGKFSQQQVFNYNDNHITKRFTSISIEI